MENKLVCLSMSNYSVKVLSETNLSENRLSYKQARKSGLLFIYMEVAFHQISQQPVHEVNQSKMLK